MKASIIIIFIALITTFSNCSTPSSKDDRALDAKTFDQMIADTNDKIILDVRTPKEFDEGHIPDAVLINVNAPDFEERIGLLDKSKSIFVYCAAGIRSEKAAAILKRSGFDKVYHLEDGFKSWKKVKKEL